MRQAPLSLLLAVVGCAGASQARAPARPVSSSAAPAAESPTSASASAPGAASSAPEFGSVGALGPIVGRPRPRRALRILDAGSTVRGELSADAVRAEIRKAYPRLRACYEAALEREPSLGGSLEIAFEIEAGGAPMHVTIAGGTLRSSDVATCIVGVIQSLNYPAPAGKKASVRYPLTLERDP